MRARGLLAPLTHPVAGEVPSVANPIRYSRTPVRHEGAPPLLGEHTEEVLRDRLGLDAARLDELRGKGVI